MANLYVKYISVMFVRYRSFALVASEYGLRYGGPGFESQFEFSMDFSIQEILSNISELGIGDVSESK